MTKLANFIRSHGFKAEEFGDRVEWMLPVFDRVSSETTFERMIARSFAEARDQLGY